MCDLELPVYEAVSYRNDLKLQLLSIIVCIAIMQQQYTTAKYLAYACVYI